MKTWGILILAGTIFAVFALYGSARMGETREQCEKRYGAGTVVTNWSDGIGAETWAEVMYRKGDFVLKVHFYKGKAILVGYLKVTEDGKTELSKTEIETLLKANSEGKKWNEVDFVKAAMVATNGLARTEIYKKAIGTMQWERSDGHAVAIYQRLDRCLIVSDKILLEIGVEEAKAKMDGF